MRANEIFQKMLEDKTLKEKYGITEEKAKKLNLHSQSNEDIVEVIKLTIMAMEEDAPKNKLNQQVKNHFKIS